MSRITRRLDGLEPVACIRRGQQVTGRPVPEVLASHQTDPTTQHLHGGFSGALMFGQRLSRRHCNQGLSELVLTPAVHGVGAATALGRLGELQMATRQGREGLFLLG